MSNVIVFSNPAAIGIFLAERRNEGPLREAFPDLYDKWAETLYQFDQARRAYDKAWNMHCRRHKKEETYRKWEAAVAELKAKLGPLFDAVDSTRAALDAAHAQA
jgi:hypothetical protein